MAQDTLIVRGAREHNLKNIDVEIPRDQFVVITGLSGSGKSSLAFDTIFAEGQRRYVESLSAYARQFLGQMEKPDVDQIEGLSPAISIDQRGASRNPRSTVGTVTEAYDYMRLLYARVGTPHCPNCGREVQQQTPQQIVDAVTVLPDGTRIQVLAPLIKDRKGHHQQVFEDVRKAGFVRVRVDGYVRDVDEQFELDRYKNHTIEAVVDRLVIRKDGESTDADRARLNDSIETALNLGNGSVIVNALKVASGKLAGAAERGEDLLFSEHFACPFCDISLPEIEPRTFSFNSPHGACPECQGLGVKMELDPGLIIPNRDLTLADGAIVAWGESATQEGYYGQLLKAMAEHYNIPLDVPVRELSDAQIELILYGTGEDRIKVDYTSRDGRRAQWETSFEGIIPNLKRRYHETTSDYMRSRIESYMAYRDCPACEGKRLRKEALAVTVGGKNIVEVTSLPVVKTLAWVEALRGNGNGKIRRQPSEKHEGRWDKGTREMGRLIRRCRNCGRSGASGGHGTWWAYSSGSATW
jgi:excinuclease ABC subunit A